MHFPAVLRQRQGVVFLDEPDVFFMLARVKTHRTGQLRQVIDEQSSSGDDDDDQQTVNLLC